MAAALVLRSRLIQSHWVQSNAGTHARRVRLGAAAPHSSRDNERPGQRRTAGGGRYSMGKKKTQGEDDGEREGCRAAVTQRKGGIVYMAAQRARCKGTKGEPVAATVAVAYPYTQLVCRHTVFAQGGASQDCEIYTANKVVRNAANVPVPCGLRLPGLPATSGHSSGGRGGASLYFIPDGAVQRVSGTGRGGPVPAMGRSNLAAVRPVRPLFDTCLAARFRGGVAVAACIRIRDGRTCSGRAVPRGTGTPCVDRGAGRRRAGSHFVRSAA